MNRLFTFVIGICCLLQVHAELKMPAIFGEAMVLQRGIEVPIWGWAEAGETVTVGYAGQSKEAVADDAGKWKLTLQSMSASNEGQPLTVSTGSETLSFDNVVVGDVWICSGQSNMEWPLRRALNPEEEIAAANYSDIRLFKVQRKTALFPLYDCTGAWKTCEPEVAKHFSAVGYFFGRHLYRELGVPIGLIHTNWGGTVAEAWTSAPALQEKMPEFKDAIAAVQGSNMEEIEAKIAAYNKAVIEQKAAVTKLYDIEEDPQAKISRAPAELDDSAWKTMDLPGNWEKRGLKGLDGIVWFRKTVELPAEWAGKDLILRPGPIDEVDTTFFNGVEVGAKGNSRQNNVVYWNQPREYKVAGESVIAGPNVIAIRVSDLAGQGGLWGAAAETMFIEVADGSDEVRIPLAGEWKYEVEYSVLQKPRNPVTPNRPSVLFNGMIQPIVPFGITGAIWYQGESNSGRAAQYRRLLPTMIGDWREQWGQGDFPFLVVQLANYMKKGDVPVESNWAELREAQAMTAANDPKVGLALAIDIGEANDIHPKNKQEVGRRLGLSALAIAYGKKVVHSGPVYQSMAVEGNKAILSFTHIDGGLVAKDGELKDFAIAGKDGKFVWATAAIEGDTVVCSSPEVPEPVAVRYAWANNPDSTLYNGAGLPAVPFRTDAP